MNKQITEDFVSYETAILLKEKGFDEACKAVYEKGILRINTLCDYYNSELSSYVCAPTHQMTLKWLREVHKIFVEPFVAIDLNGKYHYCFRLLNSICKDILDSKDLVRIDFKDSYEEAVEEALLYVLKNLI